MSNAYASKASVDEHRNSFATQQLNWLQLRQSLDALPAKVATPGKLIDVSTYDFAPSERTFSPWAKFGFIYTTRR